MSRISRVALCVFTIALTLVITSSATLQMTGTDWIDNLFKEPSLTPFTNIRQQSASAARLSARTNPDTRTNPDAQTTPNARTPAKTLPAVGSMENLLNLFKQMGVQVLSADESGRVYNYSDMAVKETMLSAPRPSAAPASTIGGTGASDGGYSQTNSQTQGVEEGDIVKTDGKYIYHLTWEGVRIFGVNGGDMELLSTIVFAQDEYTQSPSEMYVSGDRLITVSNAYEQIIYDTPHSAADVYYSRIYWGYNARQFTVYTVYDISDRKSPKIDRTFTIEGYSVATRLMGDTLYFVTSKWVYSIPEDPAPGDLLPLYKDTAVSDVPLAVPPEDVQCFPNPKDSCFLMVGSLNVTDGSPALFDSYLGGGATVYMSAENLYVVRGLWDSNRNSTGIYRFALEDGAVYYAAEGFVDGMVLNQYSMDEYDGVFRVATTDWGTGSYVTTLDMELNALGRTEALAPDESIQSVRFMGHMAYVVTYRQTDPLFSIDLSDPAHPKVLGALKIPGFSQYLHPVGDNLLVGFGRHTAETFVRYSDGREEPLGVMDAGMKISLFDISDPADVKEIDVLLLGQDTWTEAFNNPRALMVDPSRSLFGFFMNGYNRVSGVNMNSYRVIGVENGRLVEKAVLGNSVDYDAQNRMVYIGGTLYTVALSRLTAYDYQTFDRMGVLTPDSASK